MLRVVRNAAAVFIIISASIFAQFDELPDINARAMGMGGAVSALGDDANTVGENPGAMGGLSNVSFFFMGSPMSIASDGHFGLINAVGSFVFPLGFIGTPGISFNYFTISDFGVGRLFQTMQFTASYGFTIPLPTPIVRLSVGGSFHLQNWLIPKDSYGSTERIGDSTFNVTAAAHALIIRRIGVSFVAKNILGFNTSTTVEEDVVTTTNRISRSLTVGASYKLKDFFKGALDFEMILGSGSLANMNVLLGAEGFLFQSISVRGGFGIYDIAGGEIVKNMRISMGIGYRLKKVDMDVAYSFSVGAPATTSSVSASVSYSILSPVRTRIPSTIERVYRKEKKAERLFGRARQKRTEAQRKREEAEELRRKARIIHERLRDEFGVEVEMPEEDESNPEERPVETEEFKQEVNAEETPLNETNSLGESATNAPSESFPTLELDNMESASIEEIESYIGVLQKKIKEFSKAGELGTEAAREHFNSEITRITDHITILRQKVRNMKEAERKAREAEMEAERALEREMLIDALKKEFENLLSAAEEREEEALELEEEAQKAQARAIEAEERSKEILVEGESKDFEKRAAEKEELAKECIREAEMLEKRAKRHRGRAERYKQDMEEEENDVEKQMIRADYVMSLDNAVTLERKVEEKREEAKNLRAQAEILIEGLKGIELEAQAREKSEELSELRDNIKDKTEKLNNLRKAMKSGSHSDAASIQEQIKKLQTEISTLMAKAQTLESEIKSLKSEGAKYTDPARKIMKAEDAFLLEQAELEAQDDADAEDSSETSESEEASPEAEDASTEETEEEEDSSESEIEEAYYGEY